MGRPPIGRVRMTDAERQRRHRAKVGALERPASARPASPAIVKRLAAFLRRLDVERRRTVLSHLAAGFGYVLVPRAMPAPLEPRMAGLEPAPVSPRRELLRWAGGEREATGTAADEAYYVVARDPNSDAFEVDFYANEDSRGQQLAGDFATMEAARTAAEVHNAGRPR